MKEHIGNVIIKIGTYNIIIILTLQKIFKSPFRSTRMFWLPAMCQAAAVSFTDAFNLILSQSHKIWNHWAREAQRG